MKQILSKSWWAKLIGLLLLGVVLFVTLVIAVTVPDTLKTQVAPLRQAELRCSCHCGVLRETESPFEQPTSSIQYLLCPTHLVDGICPDHTYEFSADADTDCETTYHGISCRGYQVDDSGERELLMRGKLMSCELVAVASESPRPSPEEPEESTSESPTPSSSVQRY